jgi:hypothetical protein
MSAQLLHTLNASQRATLLSVTFIVALMRGRRGSTI